MFSAEAATKQYGSCTGTNVLVIMDETTPPSTDEMLSQLEHVESVRKGATVAAPRSAFLSSTTVPDAAVLACSGDRASPPDSSNYNKEAR